MRALGWVLGLSLLIVAGAAAQVSSLSGISGDEIKALQQQLAADGCYQGAIDGQASGAVVKAIKVCPSQDPILQIETGMHVAKISRIGVDRACRIAATGSDDKTVRVWSLPDGRLLHTLRVPIGSGDGGKIYATAVSPDGRWIAAGGWDAFGDIAHENFVYVFNGSTGAVATRIGPFDDVFYHLTFSPDGLWLAATSTARVGLKVIDTQTWRIVAKDQPYGDDSYGAAFGPDGRLYTVAIDNKLRQYGPGPTFKKEREASTPGGAYSVAVDPRGQLLAVAFANSTRVNIYDAVTLKFRVAANTKGIDIGDLGSIAWSSDGTRLFAGGRYIAQFQGQFKARLDLLVNGRPVKAFGLPIKPLSPDTENAGSLQVTLTQHVSEVGLIAWSEGLASQAVQVKITWDGAPEATRKLYALVIGVSNYADPAMTLNTRPKTPATSPRRWRRRRAAIMPT